MRIDGRRHAVRAGEIAWVNCHQPHEHGANPENPWEVYWVRIEGPQLEAICRMLSAREGPVFSGVPPEHAAAVYRNVFQIMWGEAREGPALIHAEVARLLSLVFCARLGNTEAVQSMPSVLRKPVDWMRLFYFESVRVADLARMAGLSPGHFTRLFKASFGTSPIDWLRRERISQAKRRLVESRSSIKEIAEQVGYPDRFFFSKDFKSHTGLSPRAFRERESAASG